MKQPKIIVAGIGPGSEQDITPAVLEAVREADVVVGYKYYFRFIQPYLHPETCLLYTSVLDCSVTQGVMSKTNRAQHSAVSHVPQRG